VGRSENLRKGPKNPEAEKLEKNQDQGVDAHEQRKETKEESKSRSKGGNGQDYQDPEKEEQFPGRETRTGLGSERRDRGKTRRDHRGTGERRRSSSSAGSPC
jgi:hypothetical protein